MYQQYMPNSIAIFSRYILYIAPIVTLLIQAVFSIQWPHLHWFVFVIVLVSVIPLYLRAPHALVAQHALFLLYPARFVLPAFQAMITPYAPRASIKVIC